MPIRPIAYVPQPYAGKRHTPDTSRLSALYTQGGETLANLALQRGQNAARLFDRLGALFTGFHEFQQQKKATLAATALKHQEREEERAFQRELKAADRKERADERKADTERAQRAEDRAAARWMVDNAKPGPMSKVAAELALRFPETAARFSPQVTLPARPIPGAAGEMSTVSQDTGNVVLHQSPDDARGDEQLAAQRARWGAEDAARLKDDQRADQSLAATIANQKAMRRIAQQNADTAAANSQARLGVIGGDTKLTDGYRNAVERVLSRVPANRRGPMIAHATRLFEESNEKELKDFIRQNAIDTEPVESRNQVLGRMGTIASLEDTRQVLHELKQAGVPTNWFTGTVEDLARKLGTSTDPRYVEMSNRLAGTLINYRRAATGVAFGEKESAQYEKMFPNYKNTLPVNEALINGLLRDMRTFDRVFWDHKLGPDGASLIIGAPDTAAAPKPGVRILSITPVTKP